MLGQTIMMSPVQILILHSKCKCCNYPQVFSIIKGALAMHNHIHDLIQGFANVNFFYVCNNQIQANNSICL